MSVNLKFNSGHVHMTKRKHKNNSRGWIVQLLNYVNLVKETSRSRELVGFPVWVCERLV